MATTGFGQGLLAGLQGAAGYNQGIQKSQTNALLQEKQLREFETQDNAALVSQLSNKGLLNLEASNKDQILNTDIETLFRDNKEVALQLANRMQVLNQAEKEDGGKVGTKAVDYIINEEDGSYSFIMEREDNGKRVPLTQGRTELGDDIVAKFSAEDLSRVVNTQMVDVLEKGGFGSKFGFMATTAALHPHQLQAEIQRKAAEDAAVSTQPGAQEMASQMSFLVTQTDDISTLEKYATDLGLDVDAIRAKADADAKANADAAGNTTSPDGTQPDATTTQTTGPNDLSWLDDASGPDKRAARRLIDKIENLPSLISNKISPALKAKREAELEEAKSQLDALKEATAADPIGRLSAADQRALANARSQKKNQTTELERFKADGFGPDAKQIKLRVKRIAEADATIQKLEGKMRPEPAPQPDPVIPPLSADQLRTSIMEATNNPESVTRTRQVLQNAGVTSLSQLRDAVQQNRVPTKEANDAIIAAAVFAANQPGATESAATMVERFRNEVLRSSQNRTLDAAIDDDQKERQMQQTEFSNQTARMNARRQGRELKRKLGQDLTTGQKPVNDLYGTIVNDVHSDDLDFGDRSNETTRKFVADVRKLYAFSTTNDGAGAKAREVMPDVLARVVLELGEEKTSSGLWGFVRDVVAGDAEAQLGNLSGRMVRNSKGEIGIRDPNGRTVVYEGVPTSGEIAEVLGPEVARALIATLPPATQF